MIFDCHLDLAMNAVHWNRDLTKSLQDIRDREAGLNDKLDRGKGVVSFEAMREGGIRFCVATQIGHSVAQNSPLQGWNSPEIAWSQTQAQLAWYREMEKSGYLRQIRTSSDLVDFRQSVTSNTTIGFILSLEGADSLVHPEYLETAFEYGLRLLGPAHYGPGRYAAGTGETDGLTKLGFELLRKMEQLGIILDVTHLTDLGFEQALDHYGGPLIASHHNCRALVDHQRQLSDAQIKTLVERNAVIGVALDAWMLIPGWVRGTTTPAETQVSLSHVADQIDHIFQVAGDEAKIAIGTDLDGGYGFEQTPIEIDSIAKLTQLESNLSSRNYSADSIKRICFENAYGFFEENLPR